MYAGNYICDEYVGVMCVADEIGVTNAGFRASGGRGPMISIHNDN